MRKRLQRFLGFLVLLLSISVSTALAQVGITAVPFLEHNGHARSFGLGSATVALNNQIGGIHLNPATIGSPGHLEITTQFYKDPEKDKYSLGTGWYPTFNTDLGFYMPAVSYSRDQWSFAYQLTYFDLGEQTHTDPQGNVLGTFQSYERAHILSAAYSYNKYVRFGAGLNFIKSKLVPSGIDVGGQEAQAGNSISLDLGVYGQYPYQISETVSLIPSAGWSLTDFGGGIKYSDNVEPDPLPMMMRLGLGAKVVYDNPVEHIKLLKDKKPLSVAYYQSFEKLMARRDTLGNTMGPFEALFNSWDKFHRARGQDMRTFTLGEQINTRGGLEVTLFEMVSIRQGYFHEAEANGGRQTSYFGFGLKYEMVSLDYVRQSVEENRPYEGRDEGREFWQFTVALSIDRIEGWLD